MNSGNFYDDTTQAHPQNSYAYTMPPPPPQKPTLKQQYKALPRWKKIGFGCGGIAGLLVWATILCTLCSAVTGAGAGATKPTPQPVAQSTQSKPTVKPTTAPTSTPTPIPTATPTPVPTPTPTPVPPTPTPEPTQPPADTAPTQPVASDAVNGNPWGYNFTHGTRIYAPADGFCNYFACVTTFTTSANGYVVECVNGKYSHSGGQKGVCSRDGGWWRDLLQP